MKTKAFNLDRNGIFKYAEDRFGSKAEYLWSSDPDSAILRHNDNAKWYALIMNISKSKLGLNSTEKIDVLNVKCDTLLIGSLLHNNGYFPAYHMNKQHWISISLDGSVADEEILNLINLSYDMTKSKRR